MLVLSLGGDTLNDPSIQTGAFAKLTGSCSVEITMSRKDDTQAQVYWSTRSQPGFTPERRSEFPVAGDGMPHTYRIDFSVDDPLEKLRIDPAKNPGQTTIHAVRLIQWVDPHAGTGMTRRLWDF